MCSSVLFRFYSSKCERQSFRPAAYLFCYNFFPLLSSFPLLFSASSLFFFFFIFFLTSLSCCGRWVSRIREEQFVQFNFGRDEATERIHRQEGINRLRTTTGIILSLLLLFYSLHHSLPMPSLSPLSTLTELLFRLGSLMLR